MTKIQPKTEQTLYQVPVFTKETLLAFEKELEEFRVSKMVDIPKPMKVSLIDFEKFMKSKGIMNQRGFIEVSRYELFNAKLDQLSELKARRQYAIRKGDEELAAKLNDLGKQKKI